MTMLGRVEGLSCAPKPHGALNTFEAMNIYKTTSDLPVVFI